MLHPAFTFVADDARATQGPGRLSGWSIPIKEGTDVAGMPTIKGNPARTTLAHETDPFAQALLDAGATIPAKTLMSELGATCYAERPGVPVLESPAYPGRTPGGSSTGAAVVVADGTARAAHGTDAGGSIRVPAAACEVVGVKLASRKLAAHGFFTTTVADQLTLLGWELPAYRRLRIGLCTTGIFAPIGPTDRRGALVEAAASALSHHHDIVEVTPYAEALETYEHFTTFITRSFTGIDPLDNPYIAWLVEEAGRITQPQVHAALAHHQQLPSLIAQQWDVDILLTPTLSDDPPALGHFPALAPEESFHAQTRWSPWCSLFNMTGAPAVALGGIHLGALTATAPELLAVAGVVEKQLQR